jgi:C1A family cysteine protease
MTDKFKYRVSPDKVDWRDRYYNFARAELREVVDMRSMASAVEQQSDLGSCTAQAIVGAYELLTKRDFPNEYKELSRLFVYYNARKIEGAINEDEGAYIRDAIKAVDYYGICEESIWPYKVENFAIQPSNEAYANGKLRRLKKYYRIAGLDDILDALNSMYPIVAGIIVYSSFNQITLENSILQMPIDTERELGAHAILLVGYDLSRRLILARNSFGPKWGDHGYFWIPFDYVMQDLTDAWIFDINLSENGKKVLTNG